jgi:HSP20 family protein
MSVIRWDPFASFDETFNRMLPSVFSRGPRLALESGAAKFEWRPFADISETDNEYLIRAELPAVKKEDVKVTIDSGILTIQGERKQEKEAKDEKVHRVESFYGSFARSFGLPENVNTDAIRCESTNGVLTVHVPKVQSEKQKPKQIKVE